MAPRTFSVAVMAAVVWMSGTGCGSDDDGGGDGTLPDGACAVDGECTEPGLERCLDGVCVECEVDENCPAEEAVCGAGHACEPCTQVADCERFVEQSVCDEASGACVQCLKDEDCAVIDWVCDEDVMTCVGCRSHDECPSDLCALPIGIGVIAEVGECVAEGNVLYVEEGGDGTDCTRADPCGSIQQAVDEVFGDRNKVKVAAGDYAENVVMDVGFASIHAEPGAVLSAVTSGPPVIDLQSGDLEVRGLEITGATGAAGADGIGCFASTLTLVDVTIRDNEADGIRADFCQMMVLSSQISGNKGAGLRAVAEGLHGLYLTSSRLYANAGGGVSLDGVEFVVVNNFIHENGNAGVTSPAVAVSGDAASSRLEHNTIVGNLHPTDAPSGVVCTDLVDPLTFINNIIHDNGGSTTQVSGDGCDHRYSLIGPDAAPGTGNISVAPSFVDADADDYHLEPNSRGVDEGTFSAEDLDIDGDPRPVVEFDIGADEVPQ